MSSQPIDPRWPQWMNRQTLAKYLDISQRHCDSLIASSSFPASRKFSDRTVRFDRDEIDAWAAAQPRGNTWAEKERRRPKRAS